MSFMLPIIGIPFGPGIGLVQASFRHLYLPQAGPPGCAQKIKFMHSHARRARNVRVMEFMKVKDLHFEAMAKSQRFSNSSDLILVKKEGNLS